MYFQEICFSFTQAEIALTCFLLATEFLQIHGIPVGVFSDSLLGLMFARSLIGWTFDILGGGFFPLHPRQHIVTKLTASSVHWRKVHWQTGGSESLHACAKALLGCAARIQKVPHLLHERSQGIAADIDFASFCVPASKQL